MRLVAPGIPTFVARFATFVTKGIAPLTEQEATTVAACSLCLSYFSLRLRCPNRRREDTPEGGGEGRLAKGPTKGGFYGNEPTQGGDVRKRVVNCKL